MCRNVSKCVEMLNRKTVLMLLAGASVLLCANALSLRISFDEGEHKSGGYMLKTGWPCAFHEQTAYRTFWEWRDLAIDAAVAFGLLAALGCGSELTIRRRWDYSHFILIVALGALIAGLNLHERTDGNVIVRGFPFVALVNGDYALHHNRIEPLGLIADLLVAIAVSAGTLIVVPPMRRFNSRIATNRKAL